MVTNKATNRWRKNDETKKSHTYFTYAGGLFLLCRPLHTPRDRLSSAGDDRDNDDGDDETETRATTEAAAAEVGGIRTVTAAAAAAAYLLALYHV